MKVGESAQIGRYDFKFTGVTDENGPNYIGGKAQIDISKDGQPEASLFAEKTFYTVSRMSMTEAAIAGGLTRDLYVALGENLRIILGRYAYITSHLFAGFGLAAYLWR